MYFLQKIHEQITKISSMQAAVKQEEFLAEFRKLQVLVNEEMEELFKSKRYLSTKNELENVYNLENLQCYRIVRTDEYDKILAELSPIIDNYNNETLKTEFEKLSGDISILCGSVVSAKTHYKKIFAIDPQPLVRLQVLHAEIMKNRKSDEAAIRLYMETLTHPDQGHYSHVNYLIAESYYNLGNLEKLDHEESLGEAAENLEQAAKYIENLLKIYDTTKDTNVYSKPSKEDCRNLQATIYDKKWKIAEALDQFKPNKNKTGNKIKWSLTSENPTAQLKDAKSESTSCLLQ